MTPINIQFKVVGLVPVNIDVFEIVISCQQRQKIVLNHCSYCIYIICMILMFLQCVSTVIIVYITLSTPE